MRCSLKKTTYACSSSLQGEAHYKYAHEFYEKHVTTNEDRTYLSPTNT